MSDQGNGDSGNNRATVALAVEKIDSLRELTRAEFGEVKSRIDKLEGLPERVTRLESVADVYRPLPNAVGGLERVTADHERRLIDLERSRDEARAATRIHWPTLIPSLLALMVAVTSLFL